MSEHRTEVPSDTCLRRWFKSDIAQTDQLQEPFSYCKDIQKGQHNMTDMRISDVSFTASFTALLKCNDGLMDLHVINYVEKVTNRRNDFPKRLASVNQLQPSS